MNTAQGYDRPVSPGGMDWDVRRMTKGPLRNGPPVFSSSWSSDLTYVFSPDRVLQAPSPHAVWRRSFSRLCFSSPWSRSPSH